MIDPIKYKLISEDDLHSSDASIDDCPEFKPLDSLWWQLSAENHLPVRREFSLSRLGKQASNLSILEIVYNGDDIEDVIIRLHASQTTEKMGDFTGQSLFTLPKEVHERTMSNILKCLEVKQPVIRKANSFSKEQFNRTVTSWTAPISSDGNKFDMIILKVNIS